MNDDPCEGFGTVVTRTCSINTVPTPLMLRVFPHEKPNNQKGVKIKVEQFKITRLESDGLSPARAAEKLKDLTSDLSDLKQIQAVLD